MLTIENMRDGYKQIVDDVLDRGKTVYPRGLQTREVLGGQFKLIDQTNALPTAAERGLSLPFAAAEAAQLIGGVSSPQLLLRVNPTMDRFLQWEQLENDYEFIEPMAVQGKGRLWIADIDLQGQGRVFKEVLFTQSIA